MIKEVVISDVVQSKPEPKVRDDQDSESKQGQSGQGWRRGPEEGKKEERKEERRKGSVKKWREETGRGFIRDKVYTGRKSTWQ